MSIDESGSTDGADVRRDVGFTLRSRLDRHCRHCEEVALVYDTAAEAPRCRVCGELDRVSKRL